MAFLIFRSIKERPGEFEENPHTVGSLPSPQRFVSGSEKIAGLIGKFPMQFVEGIRGNGKLSLLRARFYHGAKIRLSLIFAPAGILLGSAFPKPCYAACAAKISPPAISRLPFSFVVVSEGKYFHFFRQSSAYLPAAGFVGSEKKILFQPTQERSDTHSQEIQHAPPPPCGKDPHD